MPYLAPQYSNGAVKGYHLHRTRFEHIAERKLRRRQLTDDGNIEINGRDVREKAPTIGQRDLFERAAASV